MHKKTQLAHRGWIEREDSFTLIELLVVMAIIGILASLILFAGNGVFEKSKRSRASAEIQALSTALESYKTDNGIYPPFSNVNLITNTYTAQDPAQTGASAYYLLSSESLYLSLSGQTNFLDTPVAGNKAYMSFKANQVGNTTSTSTSPGATTYVKDPWGYSYGYSTGYTVTPTYPYNGNGFFDLWSTGGVTLTKLGTNPSLTNAWISNWQ